MEDPSSSSRRLNATDRLKRDEAHTQKCHFHFAVFFPCLARSDAKLDAKSKCVTNTVKQSTFCARASSRWRSRLCRSTGSQVFYLAYSNFVLAYLSCRRPFGSRQVSSAFDLVQQWPTIGRRIDARSPIPDESSRLIEFRFNYPCVDRTMVLCLELSGRVVQCKQPATAAADSKRVEWLSAIHYYPPD